MLQKNLTLDRPSTPSSAQQHTSFGPNVIGVVLSGMLDDGISGLWAIKDRGGVALVQGDAPDTVASMPECAALAVDVDAVVPEAELGALIGSHVAHLVAARSAQSRFPMCPRSQGELSADGDLASVSSADFFEAPQYDRSTAEVQPGSAVHYRRHTGHASSMTTLLLDIDDAIDKGLCDTLRAVEERVLLLRQMALAAKEAGSGSVANDYYAQADGVVAKTEPLRHLAIGTSLFGDT